VYCLFTAAITEWRVKLRRVLVDVDNDRNAYFIDSMANHEVRRHLILPAECFQPLGRS
jgi:ATP-binding cassette, subfamily B, heavy metal transporter